MKRKPGEQAATHPRLVRTAIRSLFLLLLWATISGGVIEIIQGRVIGYLFIVLGLLVVALFLSQRFHAFIRNQSLSRWFPVQILAIHLFGLIILGLPLTWLINEFPFYMMYPGSKAAFVFASVGSLLATGGLVANLIALRRDRAERSPR